jgi:hypothetical protein
MATCEVCGKDCDKSTEITVRLFCPVHCAGAEGVAALADHADAA